MNEHDNNYDYFWVIVIIVSMTYGNADDDQGYSHRKDWVWIIYDEIVYVTLGLLK